MSMCVHCIICGERQHGPCDNDRFHIHCNKTVALIKLKENINYNKILVKLKPGSENLPALEMVNKGYWLTILVIPVLDRRGEFLN
jgi:hypothetical protein